MPKMVDGSIACRISYAPEYSGKKFYCDHCGETFDDREKPPCEAVVSQHPPAITGRGTLVDKLPEGIQLDLEAYIGETPDNFEITGVIPIPETKTISMGKKKK